MTSNFFDFEHDNKDSFVLSVSRLNEYAANLLGSDSLLRFVSVEGEINGFKRYYGSGHCYFQLKDEKSSIACVMFKGYADSLTFLPKDGMRVIVSGGASLYQKEGKFQFYVQTMKSSGEGELYAAFLKTKAKLEEEGLFDESRKKTLPRLPQRVGVVTSRAGAVFHDIMNVTFRRFPGMSIVLSPCSVQGEKAPEEICAALKTLDDSGMCDVIIVGRGGGSMEDLWCFNDERVARAICACKTPVISAVGHETDFTIADFAADLRAPTPSAAAELAVPLYSELISRVASCKEEADRTVRNRLESAGMELKIAEKALKSPDELLGMREIMLDRYEQKMRDTAEKRIDFYRMQIEALYNQAEALSPFAVLKKGYAVVKNDDKIITSAKELSEKETARIVFNDGEVTVRTEK